MNIGDKVYLVQVCGALSGIRAVVITALSKIRSSLTVELDFADVRYALNDEPEGEWLDDLAMTPDEARAMLAKRIDEQKTRLRAELAELEAIDPAKVEIVDLTEVDATDERCFVPAESR